MNIPDDSGNLPVAFYTTDGRILEGTVYGPQEVLDWLQEILHTTYRSPKGLIMGEREAVTYAQKAVETYGWLEGVTGPLPKWGLTAAILGMKEASDLLKAFSDQPTWNLMSLPDNHWGVCEIGDAEVKWLSRGSGPIAALAQVVYNLPKAEVAPAEPVAEEQPVDPVAVGIVQPLDDAHAPNPRQVWQFGNNDVWAAEEIRELQNRGRVRIIPPDAQ